MNNRLLSVVVGLIIVLGAGGIFFYGVNNHSMIKRTENVTAASITSSKSGTSLTDLLGMSKNQQCNFSINDATDKTTGILYISSQSKVRGNFVITNKNTNSKVSIIRLNDDNYIWGDSFPTGIKIKLSLSQLSSNNQTNQFVNPTQKANYHCIPWTVNENAFTPPSTVQFTDVSKMIQKVPMDASKQNSVSSCAQISDPTAKTACENAMSH